MTIQDLRGMAAALQTDRKPMYQELMQAMLHAPQKEESELFNQTVKEFADSLSAK